MNRAAAVGLALLAASQPVYARKVEAPGNAKVAVTSQDERSRKSEETLGYSAAVRSGDTIYVSGVVASLQPGETDLAPAYRRAFDEIGNRLRALGSSWDDVVEITSFHTDVVTQIPVMVAVKRDYVRAPLPAWTAVGVTRLIPSSGLTEIKIVAIGRTPNRR